MTTTDCFEPIFGFLVKFCFEKHRSASWSRIKMFSELSGHRDIAISGRKTLQRFFLNLFSIHTKVLHATVFYCRVTKKWTNYYCVFFNGSCILFEGGFEILRYNNFRLCNQFLCFCFTYRYILVNW